MIPLSPSPTSRDTLPNRRVMLDCAACSAGLSYSNACVVIYGDDHQYPTPGSTTFTAWECVDCETAGYAVPVRDLVREGLDGEKGWRTHLGRKPWYSYAVHRDLEAAYNIGQRMRAIEEGESAPKPQWVPPKLGAVTERPSRVSSNPRSITTRTRTRVMERDGFKCRRCGAGPDAARLVVDHIVPVAKGGTADESNLQTLCHPCNAGKSDREPHPHDLGAKHEAPSE